MEHLDTADSYYVLWSGGIDSTYLILRLLEKGYRVRAGYIVINNNYHKAETEQSAIENMRNHIERFPNFTYDGIIYSAQNSAPIKSKLKLKQVPYFIHAMLIAPVTDFRCVGYVKGDCAIKHIPAIKRIYESYKLIYNVDLPQLVFPLLNISKPEILQYLGKNYPRILRHCVWCERPSMHDSSPCGQCAACRRRAVEILESQTV